MVARDNQGRFSKENFPRKVFCERNHVEIDHNYTDTLSMCNGQECNKPSCSSGVHIDLPNNVKRNGWRTGMRVLDLGFLLDNLKHCSVCRLGPVPLTSNSVVGELRKGLGGFLYVKCQNIDCGEVNRVAYCKTHRVKKRGMPCFTTNTNLGIAMIDSVGGAGKVNNLLSTLNIQPIHRKNLQHIERRSGSLVESVADQSMKSAAQDAFKKEMSDIANEETEEAAQHMVGLIDDLGACPMPDASPSLKERIQPACTPVTFDSPNLETTPKQNSQKYYHRRPRSVEPKAKKGLMPSYPCKRRYGMSCAVDTAWQKRGFDSQTAHTFFMSKSRYGKKVVKGIVSDRQCSTCTWWRRNRPGRKVREHRCVLNHVGSARLMESTSGEKGVLELAKEGTPVEYIDGDGDTTLLARLKNNQNITMKKRFDKNHIMKNIGKSLYSLQSQKSVKLSKNTIVHIQKCISYALSKNSGDEIALQENLRAVVPHNFGEHNFCKASFCGQLRTPGEKYVHRSLPYKTSLTGTTLREKLDDIMKPIILKASQLSDLGSSQQCEHANREVTLRAPKNIHYGGTEALDFRVKATAAFINEGRHYISKFKEILQGHFTVECLLVKTAGGISPGEHTKKYAEKCEKRRQHSREVSQLPATKRRRIILKQERAVAQQANETLEGVSYQSGIGHDEEVDIDRLPDPVPRGAFKQVLPRGPPTYIVADLETTDLIRGYQIPHITQIAACEMSTGASFNKYMIPKVPITSAAESVTKIIMINEKDMLVDGVPVEPVPLHTALTDFLLWLEKFDNIYLVAHNGRRFDFIVLTAACKACGMLPKFLSSITGLADSLPVFKHVYPGRTSCKQEDLARDLLYKEYNAHNAEADVKCLSELVSLMLSNNKDCIIVKSFPPIDVKYNMDSNREKRKNFPSLEVLVSGGVMKTATAENIASSGLNFEHLKTIFRRKGEDGILNVLVCLWSQNFLWNITLCMKDISLKFYTVIKHIDRKNSDKEQKLHMVTF